MTFVVGVLSSIYMGKLWMRGSVISFVLVRNVGVNYCLKKSSMSLQTPLSHGISPTHPLVGSEAEIDRFDELLCKQMYESDPNFRYCTDAKCHTGQIIVDGGIFPLTSKERVTDGVDAASFFKCARCGYKTCFNCSVPWHVGFTCAQYKEGLVERQFSEPRSQAWLTANAK